MSSRGGKRGGRGGRSDNDEISITKGRDGERRIVKDSDEDSKGTLSGKFKSLKSTTLNPSQRARDKQSKGLKEKRAAAQDNKRNDDDAPRSSRRGGRGGRGGRGRGRGGRRGAPREKVTQEKLDADLSKYMSEKSADSKPVAPADSSTAAPAKSE